MKDDCDPSPPAEMSEFDRVSREYREAMRESGGEPSLAAAVEWLARKMPRESSVARREPTSEFDRAVEAMKQAARNNGGSAVFHHAPFIPEREEE